MQTPNNALKKNARTSGLLVKRILNAFLLFRIVKRSVAPNSLAGLYACPLKVVKLLLMLPNALKKIIALPSFLNQSSIPMLFLLLKIVLEKNVPLNFKLAKKIPNASQLFKTVKKNV
jgi:hypothetical protein